jgi:hypothetical protein
MLNGAFGGVVFMYVGTGARQIIQFGNYSGSSLVLPTPADLPSTTDRKR